MNATWKTTPEYDIPSVRNRDNYILIYTVFILISIVLTSAAALLFYKICMKASINLHDKMFSHILQVPRRFFDTNPSGKSARLRILTDITYLLNSREDIESILERSGRRRWSLAQRGDRRTSDFFYHMRYSYNGFHSNSVDNGPLHNSRNYFLLSQSNIYEECAGLKETGGN